MRQADEPDNTQRKGIRMKIAQALLLRKQLQEKVSQLGPVKKAGEDGLFETKLKRMKVSEDVDQLEFIVPRITMDDVTKTYDVYASALRKLDASIQQANWLYDVEFKESDIPERMK